MVEEPVPVDGAAALDAIPDPVAVLDADGVVRRVNAAWEAFGADNGGSVDSVGVDYLAVCAAAEDTHAADAAVAIRAVLGGNVAIERVEYPCHAPGRKRWFQLTASAVDDPPGGAVLVHTEVTGYKQQVEVLNRVLRHNLRNELNVIGGYAAELGGRTSRPELAALVARVESATEEVLRLCDRARTVKETLDASGTTRPIDAASVARVVVESARAAFPGARIDLETAGPVRVRGGDALEVVVGELVENAVEHSDRSTPHVRVAVERTADGGVVRVVDDGPGIPADEARTLTGASEERPTRHGSGLGAAMVQTLVSALDGTVRVEPVEPRGTAVVVTLQPAFGGDGPG